VFVSGALANKPWSGGEAWVRLSYAAGLQRLGCDVTFVEQVASSPPADALRYFDHVAAAAESVDRWLLSSDGGAIRGGDSEELAERAEAADLLLNVSGHLTAPSLVARFRRRAFLDIDPGYTQIWHTSGLLSIPEHDVYFTIAENIGRPACLLPTAGIEWRTTRPPVVLDEWPAARGDPRRFTTVATWRGPYGRLEHEGRVFGIKLDEFRKVIELPRRSRQTFELALAIDPEEKPDLAALRENRWRLVDPREVAGDADSFRRYVIGSGAEFSVAQGVYVETSSGWFSDRTTRYLASGKPALVQDTGFGTSIPTGDGLVAFGTLDEAAAGAEAIAEDYARHSRAARALAEEYFDSDKVLAKLLEDALP
jgi:hypothetical protein